MTRLTLLLILALCAHVHAQSGKLTVAEAPKAATVEGYEQGHCVALRNRIRICKVLSESDALFLVEKEGKTLGTWPANAFLGMTQDFKVMHGDLDGEGKPELIVANRDDTSVGIAVSVWTIAIFPDGDFHTFQTPLTFSVKEFGPYGTIVSTGGRLHILSTDWVWSTDPNGKRGEGLYLVGEWWRYQRGQLLPLTRSIVARRYLLSFERERWNTIESDRIPYRWLSNRHTEFVSTDFITGACTSKKRGVIESVSPKDEKGPYRIVQIMFNAEAEDQAPTFVYPNENDNGPFVPRYIGDAGSGRIYPSRYLPSDPEKWLIGRRATLCTYKDDKTEILWLEARNRFL